MAQKSRPASDIATGAWSPTPIFSRLNEPAADDASKVTSGDDPAGDAFEVKLANLAWPWPGAHKLTVRLQKIGSGTMFVTIWLKQGSTAIAGMVVEATSSFANAVLDVSENQRSQITDYTDLRARVIAGFQTTSACSKCATAPATWIFSMTGCSCTVYNRTYALAHQSACLWRETGAFGVATLNYDAGADLWTLTVGNGPVAVNYTKSGASFQCMQKNVMNFSSMQGGEFCSNWPSSVEISPGAPA